MRTNRIQNYISMVSALVVLIGGLAIALFYPGLVDGRIRLLIGLFFVCYFILRMVQITGKMRRQRRQETDEFRPSPQVRDDGPKESKSS